jgi:FKBP-type peptidyl-prolyl cis-trans isomerase FkpA
MYGRRQFLWSTAVAVVAATAAGCSGSDSDDSPTEPTPPPPTGPATMQITEITVGEGGEAAAGRGVFVHYTLFRYDPAGTDSKGAQIETTVGGNPTSFVVGTTNLIPGFSQGVIGMKVGGKRRVILPPSLAYGNTGSTNGTIRPNEWIIFEYELLSVT